MLTVVVPCFNEGDNIPRMESELLPVLKSLNTDFEVLFVDDGSSDRTLEEIKNLQAKHDNLRVVSHGVNKGLGHAVRTGIKHASEGANNLLVTIDADLTFSPSFIPVLFKRFRQGDVDCVIGSPFLGSTEEVQWYRKFLSVGVNALYQVLLWKRITSVSPIFRLYKTSQLKELELNCERFDINAEILFRLLQKRCKVVEVPANLTVRKFGVSKLDNKKEIRNHIHLLSKILKWRLGL